MGASMTVASEKAAYILTDRATYLANKDNYQLEILVEGDNSLLNVYHVITVNAEKWTAANYEGALPSPTSWLIPTHRKSLVNSAWKNSVSRSSTPMQTRPMRILGCSKIS